MLEHWRGAGGGEGKSLFVVTGDVRQVIETSTDEGRSWTTGFDAIYRRRN